MKLIRVIQSKIVKKDNKYQVQSEKGKNLGTYDTKSEAEKRLKQVEMFKHMKKSKLMTKDDIDVWFEEQLRKQGFPSDEELYKEYEQYLKKMEIKNNSQKANLYEEPIDFASYKRLRLDNFSNKNIGDKTSPRKWNLVDEWVETTDDPIEDPKDIQI